MPRDHFTSYKNVQSTQRQPNQRDTVWRGLISGACLAVAGVFFSNGWGDLMDASDPYRGAWLWNASAFFLLCAFLAFPPVHQHLRNRSGVAFLLGTTFMVVVVVVTRLLADHAFVDQMVGPNRIQITPVQPAGSNVFPL